MKTKEEILAIGKQVLAEESLAIQQAQYALNLSFAEIVEAILQNQGRLVLSGIGKSALIAQKITASLNSTGTPSIFMHAAEAIHGDLGMIQNQDIVMVLSHSGNTPEIKYLSSLIKKMGNTQIALTGNSNSELAKNSDMVLSYNIEKEACPLNLAPTTSTLVQLALGDALTVALLSSRNFSSSDFSKYHPGGNLGKKLYLSMGEIAKQNEKPLVNEDDSVQQCILEISKKRMGACAVANKEGKICGIITDGDIRRMLENHLEINTLKAKDLMGKNPKSIGEDLLAAKAVEIFKTNKINQLIVLDLHGKYIGMVHLHDLHKEGII